MPEKKTEKSNPHQGHRDRLKTQFRKHGLEGFTDIQALELLLFYALPRIDTNGLAHRLLDRFHTFRGVMEASVPELCEVEGISKESATLITLVAAMNRRYLSAKRNLGVELGSIDAICTYCVDMFRYCRTEEVHMICLSAERTVISVHKLGVGDASAVGMSMRQIACIALREGALGVVLTHNHLTDIAIPSKEDIQTTQALRKALRLLDIALVDHVVVADNDAVSMSSSGVLDE